MLLVGLFVGMLTPAATASIPNPRYSANTRGFSTDSQIGVFSIQHPEDWIAPFDLYPFYGEFYLHQFASESPANLVRQRSYRFRLSNVAWGLSKRAATLRRALARMMP